MINKVVQGWINYYTQNAEEARLLEANYSISSKQYVENGIHMKILSKISGKSGVISTDWILHWKKSIRSFNKISIIYGGQLARRYIQLFVK